MLDMANPLISEHFLSRQPSAIRTAQINFAKRKDQVDAINTAIGNVTLPMHPVMIERMYNLDAKESPFADGSVQYTATIGMEETCSAVLNVISASGVNTKGLFAQITDGGSSAMELLVLGVCGPAGTKERPLLMIDAAYTNYLSMADRVGRKTVSVIRNLGLDGKFTLPDMDQIEKKIQEEKPGALMVIPYDNPTGHFYSQKTLIELAKLCVKYNLWLASDEAYRELYYVDNEISSTIWKLTEADVPGITGRRISIESASKTGNACGLRIGALVTDNELFHEKSVAEYTANLCANAIGQYIYGALAHLDSKELNRWFVQQRNYYKALMTQVSQDLKAAVPGLIVSSPDASIYSVIDVRKIAKPGFNALDFVLYCATKGSVNIGGKNYTLLVSPMNGFYQNSIDGPGVTQMRIAYVESPERMKLVPELFARLFSSYK